MSSYRCYFVDVTNHIAADHFVECETDDLAQARADELLADTEYPAMEAWDGARFVCEAKGWPVSSRSLTSKISRPTYKREEWS